MERIFVKDLRDHVGARVRLAGWVHHRRRLGRLVFVVIRDATGLAQVVAEGDGVQVAQLLPESVVEVEGEAADVPAATGGVELRDPVFSVLATAAESPPIELRRARLKERRPTLLDHAPLALRHPRERAKLTLAAASIAGFRSALDRLGFTEIQTPKIVAAATEGGAGVFEIDYFGRRAYLAQSPQLYKQIMVGVFERVYETGPVFRAEPHETGRHLAEYVSLDAEMGFITDHRDVMALVREVVAGMVESVRGRAASAVELLGLELPFVATEIPVIDFIDAQELIERATGEPVIGEPDFAPAHERWLGEWAQREHGSDLVSVAGYPMEKRPFYTHPDPTRPRFSNSFDLIFRGVELSTGGQRLNGYDDYVAALGTRGLSAEPFESYLQAFRFGMPPHGGFAIGLERWVGQLAGAANIRETTLFPRDRQRLTP